MIRQGEAYRVVSVDEDGEPGSVIPAAILM